MLSGTKAAEVPASKAKTADLSNMVDTSTRSIKYNAKKLVASYNFDDVKVVLSYVTMSTLLCWQSIGESVEPRM
jgi:hypothetical protein